jgi:hypothetical protein
MIWEMGSRGGAVGVSRSHGGSRSHIVPACARFGVATPVKRLCAVRTLPLFGGTCSASLGKRSVDGA